LEFVSNQHNLKDYEDWILALLFAIFNIFKERNYNLPSIRFSIINFVIFNELPFLFGAAKVNNFILTPN